MVIDCKNFTIQYVAKTELLYKERKRYIGKLVVGRKDGYSIYEI